MPDTLGSLRAEVLGWLRGDYASQADTPLVNSAINDAIESIWNSMMRVQLARFFGLDSPVTFSLPTSAERVQLVTIADPTGTLSTGAVGGGSLGSRFYELGFTLVTESGSETLMSPPVWAQIGANNLATVNLPAGLVGPGVGWNLYVGSTTALNTPSTAMGLQNQQPIAFGVQYNEPVTGFQDYPTSQQQPPPVSSASSPTPASAPPPSANTTADNIAWITHMEVRTSDTLLRTWNQYDIDSEIMKRYGRTLSSASEYQTYVWDIINGNRLEIRPSAGMAFSPRYFYIARPRRLRYDQAEVPYQGITGVHAFVVAHAIAMLKLGQDEYLAHQAWIGRAEAYRLQIDLALTQELWAKNARIAPHLFSWILPFLLSLKVLG